MAQTIDQHKDNPRPMLTKIEGGLGKGHTETVETFGVIVATTAPEAVRDWAERRFERRHDPLGRVVGPRVERPDNQIAGLGPPVREVDPVRRYLGLDAL
mgnify:CR=1 FL=1